MFSRTVFAVNPFCDIINIDMDQYKTPYYYDILVLYGINLFHGMKGANGNLYAYPERYLSREQAACLIAEAFSLGDNGNASSEPKDINDVSEYAKVSVMKCLQNKVIGLNDDNFYPKETITKYEFLEMIKTILHKLKPDFKFD